MAKACRQLGQVGVDRRVEVTGAALDRAMLVRSRGR
jgi:hypothetical protein